MNLSTIILSLFYKHKTNELHYMLIKHYYKERLKHAIRFRTKRGFGVHSPYMFNLITNILRNRKCNTNNYPPFTYNDSGERKLFQLTHRLKEHIKPEKIFAMGARSERLKNYIKDVKITTSLSDIDSCKFLWIDIFNTLLDDITPTIIEWCNEYEGYHAILITNINKIAQQRSMWQILAPKAKVKVEMMWCGLLIFDTKLQPGSYHLLP